MFTHFFMTISGKSHLMIIFFLKYMKLLAMRLSYYLYIHLKICLPL